MPSTCTYFILPQVVNRVILSRIDYLFHMLMFLLKYFFFIRVYQLSNVPTKIC